MKVIIISGPTASGKTALAIELARRFGGEVVNFDSLLLYRELNIGTAKPTPEELRSVPHHLIDVRSIKDPMNAADYAREALPVVEALRAKHKLVYLVGGSGFYLQALLKGMYDSPTTPAEIQRRSDDLYARSGIEPFRELLREHDPETWRRHPANDHYRIRRAVEHWWTKGTTFSEERRRKDEANTALGVSNVHGWQTLHLFLDLPKEEHLKIITRRTDAMLAQGLLGEVTGLLAAGYSGLEKPFQCIGYKEILGYHFGVYPTLQQCRDRIIISTRQLAKSQRTWFNREPEKFKLHPLRERERARELVEKFLQN
jgi:tRNA dimethylallyltransferase